MKRAVTVLVGCVVAMGLGANASAQTSVMIGNWAGSTFAPDGVHRYAMTLKVDETYVSMLSLPNGTTQRVWGKYRVTKLSPTDWNVAFTKEGWLPYKTCVKGTGHLPRCTSYAPIAPSPVTVKFASPVTPQTASAPSISFRIESDTWTKQLSTPTLMSQIVPDHQMLASSTTPTVFGKPAPRKYEIPP